ncbi:CDT1-like protein [Actinidia chinensis var. chinensis]|uniref:CDT1-like protein n=1 Tax=Actinidia chinensis var. chinensis TaxID=1590841 RepID=A0A2R6P3I5_ACTCC|nr:CDT1-like protein [Actinidia chinensis var. chinensis]
MDERKYEKRGQNALDFKCENILPGIENSSILSPGPMQALGNMRSQHVDTKIAALTPEKTNESLHHRQREEAAELPEKYRIIAEYFNRMTCSLRLLALRKKLPTFQNISRQVEILTGRKFSYRNLAQIKYILPEAVQIDKVLIRDEKTLCVKPDIKITLLFDVVDGHQKESIYLALHQVFASRLLNFSNKHPEGCEIPEAEMPEPFNRGSDTIIINAFPMDSSTESQQNISETELLLNTSHLHPSFNRHFSQKVVTEIEKNTQLLASPIPTSSPKNESVTDQHMGSMQLEVPSDVCSRSTTISNPVHLADSACCISSIADESTPLKVISKVNNLTVQTPALLTPKRSIPSCDKNLTTMTSEKWTACNVSAKRSLDFSLIEGEESALNSTTNETDWSKAVHNTISQTKSTKGLLLEEEFTCSAALHQKAEEICTSKDQMTNQTGLTTHGQTSTRLSDLIALIHQNFQSASCSSITKDELVHKIIINSLDIVDRREVEEQIELLEKLIPDWICRKSAPSGDILYNIKKVSDLNSICKRLY